MAEPTFPHGSRQRRTGGRSAEVLGRVKSALEELISERGPESISIPMVATRAGVQPSSLYRRWGDIGSLMNQLATYKLDPGRPIPVSGPLLENLAAWAQGIVDHYSRPANAAMLRAGAATSGSRMSDCLRDRCNEAAHIIGAAEDITDIDVDQVLNHLVAPIIYRVIFLPWTIEPSLVPQLVSNLSELTCEAEDVSSR
jgi:AcrR family transcriptional regulator